MQRRIPGALASGLARTLLIDDLLENGLRQGIRQVILLGAGFDMRAMRLDSLRAEGRSGGTIGVIEIDHPDTQRKKLSILKRIRPVLSSNTRYLPIDFDRQSLEDLFVQQGIDFSLPTLFIWEGVTNYLQADAVSATFALAGRFAEGSMMVFTYVNRRVLEEPASFFGAERLLGDLERIEEKWTFGFIPEELPGYLRDLGWELVEDMGAATYREKYLPERKGILHGYEFYRVAMAVKGMGGGSR